MIDEPPSDCYYCGQPLGYTPDRANQLEAGKPIVKWICNDCWVKRHKKAIVTEPRDHIPPPGLNM